ncbi:MAG TPA: M50 family metallopeptidase [Allosphingosinicella sp.]|nr:M50 family metallopeptidase [Allosphingosinicella sp.]
MITSSLAGQEHKHRVTLLAGIALASVVAWQTEFGSLLLYPFTILTTWFHEMGHGLAAMLAGRGFERLLIFPDGSGVALSLRPADGYRLTDALVAASGPLGPAIAGAALIVASRSPAATRIALAVLGAALVLSTLIWVRSPTGWLVLPAMGLGIALLALRGSVPWQRFAIQFLGVQAAISAWQQFGYLFSPGGTVGGELQRSDTGAIADVLLLPYWFWGAIISGAILALLWWSFRRAFRR